MGARCGRGVRHGMKAPRFILLTTGLVLGTVACSSTTKLASTAASSATTQLAARQGEVSAKGAEVMPFDLAAGRSDQILGRYVR